jgi:hypothetical protein
MLMSEDGDCSGVLSRDLVVAMILGSTGFSPKGSSRNCSVSSSSSGAGSGRGGVGGRAERESNLEN